MAWIITILFYGSIKHAVPSNAVLYMDVGPVVNVIKDRSAELDSISLSKLAVLNLKCGRAPIKEL